MAELNFGLLTPPGSQSIGNAFAQGMDQAAVARAQENQNALAQYTLGKARREDQQQNELYAAVRQPGFKFDIGTAMRFGAPGLAAYKAQQDADKNAVDIAYTQARTGAIPTATAKAKAETDKLLDEAQTKTIAEIAGFPNADSANAAIDARLSNKTIDQTTADRLRQGLTPENFTNWKHDTLIRMLAPAEQLKQGAVTHVDTPRGGFISRQYFDAQGKAYGPEQRLDITVSPNTTAQINATRRNHLETLAQQGWTFDTDRGLAVNPRLGISQQISTLMAPVESRGSAGGVAPAAPAAIPTAPSAAPAGTPITQPRAATLGTFPRVTTVQQTNNMEGATAIRRQELVNEQSALENARQKLASPAAANDPDIRKFYEERFKEATNNIDALNKELRNQPAQPSATQPAQRTVLGPKPADLQKTEIELNKQYVSESKGFTETKIAIDKAKAALKDAATNPTAGLSAGTAFMKILDPQSVVRETELAMALKSSGWFDRATNVANTLQAGKTILTPTQITNLNKTIDGLFEEVKAEQRIVDAGYTTRAKSYGLDIKNIITDRGQNKKAADTIIPANAPPIQSFRRR